jgi:hypothetical protein
MTKLNLTSSLLLQPVVKKELGMKQLIIMVAMVSLGLAIYGLILGDDEGSIMTVTKGIWQDEIDMRTGYP